MKLLKSLLHGHHGFIVLCIVDAVMNLFGQVISIWGAKALGDLFVGVSAGYGMLCLGVIFYGTIWQGLVIIVNYGIKRYILKIEVKVRKDFIQNIGNVREQEEGVQTYIAQMKRKMDLYDSYIRYSCLGIVSIIGSILMCAALDWRILIVSVLLGIVILGVNMLSANPLSRLANHYWGEYLENSEELSRIVNSMDIIGTFPKHNLFLRDFSADSVNVMARKIKATNVYNLVESITKELIFIFQIGLVLAGLVFLKRGWMTLGVVLGGIQAASNIMGNVNYIGSIFSTQRESIVANENVDKVLTIQKKDEGNLIISESGPLLKACELNFSYQDSNIIDGISLCIQKRDFVLLQGENGTGKSTLFKLLLGFLKGEDGTITWNTGGEAFNRFSSEKISYLPQKGYVLPWLSLKDNIVLGRSIDDDKYQDLLKELEIEYLDKRENLEGISGGEERKIMMARIILEDKPIIFLDEPFVNLDHGTRQRLKELLGSWHETGKTIVLIDHEWHDLTWESLTQTITL